MINTYLFYPQYQDGNPPFITQWLPYSVAAVWAYVDQFSEIKENFKLKEIIFKREPIDTVVSRLDNPGVCLFSNYLCGQTIPSIQYQNQNIPHQTYEISYILPTEAYETENWW